MPRLSCFENIETENLGRSIESPCFSLPVEEVQDQMRVLFFGSFWYEFAMLLVLPLEIGEYSTSSDLLDRISTRHWLTGVLVSCQ